MILNKRLKRELTQNSVRYLGLFLLVLLSVSLVIGLASSTDSINNYLKEIAINNNLEDGNFTVITELSDGYIDDIRKIGFEVEKDYYVDYNLSQEQTVRIFSERTSINKIAIMKGEKLVEEDDILIDKLFAEENGYDIGDKIDILNHQYTVVGYGISPEYTLPLKNVSDLSADPSLFGVGYIKSNVEDFTEEQINYSYSFQFSDKNLSDESKHKLIINLKDKLKEDNRVTNFYDSESNTRITSCPDKVNINKSMAFILGVVLLIITAFLFGVVSEFIISKESAVIGALYAMGYIKSEITRHFLILPIVITSIASIIGTFVGFEIFTKPIADSMYSFYCIAKIKSVYPIYLLIFGLVAPIVINLIINYIMLSKRLNLTPLKLLRKDIKEIKVSKMKLRGMKFLNKFRIRLFFREFKNNIVLFIGLLLGGFLLVMGFGINDTIKYYIEDVKNNPTSQNLYILKAPYELKDNKDAEKLFMTNFGVYYSLLDRDMGVTIQGIQEDSEYIDVNLAANEPAIYLSEATSNKFGIKTGDTIELINKNNDEKYQLKVKGTYYCPEGLYAVMNIKYLNELLGFEENNFNAYFSNEELDIDSNYLLSRVTTEQIYNTAKDLQTMMSGTVVLLIVVAVVIYVLLMYLLVKITIDKSSNNISSLKIFGYNNKEINKLYLRSTFYTILIAIIIAVPINQAIFSMVWPPSNASFQGFIPLKIYAPTYAIIVGLGLVSYLLINQFLKYHLSKISYNDVLKDRE